MSAAAAGYDVVKTHADGCHDEQTVRHPRQSVPGSVAVQRAVPPVQLYGCRVRHQSHRTTHGCRRHTHTLFGGNIISTKTELRKFTQTAHCDECCCYKSCCQTPFTGYCRLSNRLFNRFNNRLYRVNGVSGA